MNNFYFRPFSTFSPARLFVFFLSFIVIISPFRAQTVFYSKPSGNLNLVSTWGVNPDGSGTSPNNFNTAGRLYVITNTSSLTIGAAWTVGGTGSKIQVGDGINGTEFVIPANFGVNATMDVANNGTLTILDNANPTIGTLATGSTVKYGRLANQAVVNTTYYNLVLSGSGLKALQNNFSTTITNSLIINSGVTFRLHGNNSLTATISGSVSGAGTFVGSANSVLNITGAGDFGTIDLSTNTNLYALTLNRSNGKIFLGSNVNVNDGFVHNSGMLELNSNVLTLDGAITFPSSVTNGCFIGSSSSSLVIGNSNATITGSLCMDQSSTTGNTVNRLSFNRSGQVLSLATDLKVLNSFIHTNGVIDLNGRAFSIGGIITFPNTLTDGYFRGSATSSLTIDGAGTVNNSLKMDQSSNLSKTLGLFKIDHTLGSILLGDDLICGTLFDHVNGTLSLGTNHLYLDGGVSFPLSSTNGGITGSATSSLSIAGSGSFTNALQMTQSNATTRTLAYLNLNRPAQRLSLGNPLIVTALDFTNGEFNLNGTLLTLNGRIIFPSTSSNGIFVGSNTSSLTIATSVQTITNAFCMSQVNTGEQSLSAFSISRAAQTFSLGSDVQILNAFTHSNGNIAIGPYSLSVGGVITFPATIANGYLLGSASSSFAITGSGAISNTLKFDLTNVTGRTLNAFLIDHTGGTVSMGTDIICPGNFNHVNGPLTLNTTALTLNGAISFPLSATNGSITGSATSTLIVGGSGTISNALFMAQNSAAARTLNNFSFNRSGAVLSMGNPLICNIYTHTNGQLNLNGSFLTLSSIITFPASASNGGFIGSLTSSLTINGLGAINNALRFDQATPANRSLFDLVMARAGQVLTLGDPLEIRNSATPTNGTLATAGLLTLKADGSRSAMIGSVGGALTGNLNVETYAPGGYTGWTNLGPSGVTMLSVSSWENQFPMTCIGCPYNEYSAGGYFVSIQGYNETLAGSAAYVPLSYTSPLTTGLGYWVYLGTGQFTSAALNYSVSGPAVTGNVVIPLTVSSNSGNNLVSNPYPAPIDWDLVTADLANINVSGSIYFFNPDIGQTISYAGGVSNPSGYIANGIIPMGQGFYVMANTAGNITFRESHKSSQNTNVNPLLRITQPDPGNVFRLSLTGPAGDYDETTFRFHTAATDTFDRLFDALKLFETPGYLGTASTYSNYTTISSRTEGKDFAINSMPYHSTDQVIPILVRAQTAGRFKISALGIENFEQTSCLSLYDKWLGKEHDLRRGDYFFDLQDTVIHPRFELKICAGLTSVGLPENQADPEISIFSDATDGVHVKTAFEKEMSTTISVYDLMGQKIAEDVRTEAAENNTYLPLNNVNQNIVIIRVQNQSYHVVRKVVLH